MNTITTILAFLGLVTTTPTQDTKLSPLYLGAQMARQGDQTTGWQPMSVAPRDGTVIEMRNTNGAAPWFELFRWSDLEMVQDADGNVSPFHSGVPRWSDAEPGQAGIGIGNEGAGFMWRPYNGDPTHYVDPTGGAQNDPAYERGAVAVRLGLPVDYFEQGR